MNDLSGRHFDRYKVWRRENGDLNNVTLNTQLSTVRVFIKWAESIDAVAKGTHEYITPPSMAPKEDVRTVILEDDKAADLLRHLGKFEYATRNHALISLLWHTGIRTGAARAIDLEDIDRESRSLYIRHRPEQGTPLTRWTRRLFVAATISPDVVTVGTVDEVSHSGVFLRYFVLHLAGSFFWL